MKKKLLIISRDGYAVREFAHKHRLAETDYKRVKRFEDMFNVEISGYVIIRPTPPGFDEMIEYLESEEYENKTSYYNKRSRL